MININDKTYYSGDEACQIANHQFYEGYEMGKKEMKDYILFSYVKVFENFESLGITPDKKELFAETFDLVVIHWTRQLLDFLDNDNKNDRIENVKEYKVGDVSFKPDMSRTKDLQDAIKILGFQFEEKEK